MVDALVTNFYLAMLVSAFSGVQTMRDAYNHAIANQYRFFSYGDAMLLTVQQNDVKIDAHVNQI